MIQGGCLCAGIRFEITKAVGPFELCHCNRCRKSSGSAFVAAIGVQTEDFTLLRGQELIAHYDAPILHRPPPYRASFCSVCGSPAPNPVAGEAWCRVLIPAKYEEIEDRVCCKPAGCNREWIPPVYEDQERKVCCKPATCKTIRIPAEYKDETSKVTIGIRL